MFIVTNSAFCIRAPLGAQSCAGFQMSVLKDLSKLNTSLSSMNISLLTERKSGLNEG